MGPPVNGQNRGSVHEKSRPVVTPDGHLRLSQFPRNPLPVREELALAIERAILREALGARRGR